MLKQHFHSTLFRLFVLTAIGTSITSCFNYKNQIFFQGLKDSTYSASTQQADLQIQRGDQLSIFVYAADQMSMMVFNAPMYGGGLNGVGGQVVSQQQSSQGGGYFGYLVDEYGNIEFPKLG